MCLTKCIFYFILIIYLNTTGCPVLKLRCFFFRHDTCVFFSYTIGWHVPHFLSVTTGGYVFSIFLSKESYYQKQQRISYLIIQLWYLLQHRNDSECNQNCLTSFNSLTFCISSSLEFPLYEGNLNVLSGVAEWFARPLLLFCSQMLHIYKIFSDWETKFRTLGEDTISKSSLLYRK